MAFKLGTYDSHLKLVETLASVTDIPQKIRVVDSSSGFINEGTDKQRMWANLTAVDLELYQRYESIEQEQFCPTFKIKIKNYQGQNLEALIDSEISFNNHEVTFIYDKFKQPIGLALVIDLATILVK